MTLSDYIWKSVAYGMGIFLALSGIMAYVWYSTPYNYDRGTASDIMAIRPHAKGTVMYVKKHNTCKPTVKDTYPTGLIYQDETGRAHFSQNPVHIAKGLDEEFAGKAWKHGTVNYFCK